MAAPDKDRRGIAVGITKKSEDKFSRFFCQQYMYDYLTGDLDVRRSEFLKKQLAQDNDLKLEFESLKESINYCNQIKVLRVHHDFMEQMLSQKTFLDSMYSRIQFKSWPDFIKWGAEALAIGVFVAFLMVMIPWDKIETQIIKNKRHEFFLGARTSLIPVEDHRPEQGAEIGPPATVSDSGVTLEVQPSLAETLMSEATLIVEVEKPEQPRPKPIAAKPIEPKQPAEPVAPAARVEIGSAQPTRALRGELYRLFMRVSNVDDVTNTIKAEIERLGGDKAGEVPLGWKKDGGSYFHFTIPADKHETLLNQIKLLGPITEQKESHWRVMQQGTHRMILNVMPRE